jgi:integrase
VSLLTIAETAALLSVSTSWVHRHLRELPVVPVPGNPHLRRIDSEAIQCHYAGGKSLKPEEPIMLNRFQRGTVKLRGRKQMWYGRFRLETKNAKGEREFWHNPIGLKSEFPTKFKAEEKLREIMKGFLKSGVSTKAKLFSTLVEEWKATEGTALGRSTFDHYSDALRAYVVPTFGSTDIRTITRKTIQDFLVVKAKKYGALKDMRLVLCMTLAWAEQVGYLEQPNGWLEGIRLPRKVGGRKVVRVELEPEQTREYISRLREPYSTLVLLLASVGLRGEAAIGLQPGDLDAKNVLRVKRVIYKNEVIPLTDAELLKHVFPLDALVHAELLQRLRALGSGAKWIFHGRSGEPLNLGNARRRELRKVEESMDVRVGGWHDFRHTLKRQMRRAGVDRVVVRDTLGHANVDQQEVYDEAKRSEVGEALRLVGKRMEPKVEPNSPVR